MKRVRRIGCLTVFSMVFTASVPAWSQTAWNAATDGVWSNAAQWTAGVPDGNNATLGQGAASYTVTVNSTPPAFGGLTITNVAGNTTTLDIEAAGFRNLSNKIIVGRGAVVRVKDGGEWRYEGTNAADLPFMTIKDGGEVQINGGTLVLTNRQTVNWNTDGSSLNIGQGSTGRLTVTSGRLIIATNNSTATQDGTKMTIGAGGGYGILDISGGTVEVQRAASVWNAADIQVASDSSAWWGRGEINVTGNGALLASNGIVMYVGGGTESSGRVYVADSGRAVFGSRFNLGGGTRSKGYLTVAAGSVTVGDAFGVGYGTDATGVVTVAGGKLTTANFGVGSDSSAIHASTNKQFNLFGGWADFAGQATAIGYARYTTTWAYGEANLTNGLLTTSYGGAAPTMAVGHSFQGGNAVGVLNISGTAVWTNTPFLMVGYRSEYAGSATGTVNQTGGSVFCFNSGWQNPGNALAMGLGVRGGWGQYLMSGGSFVSLSPLYVGGSGALSSTNASWGLLKVTGGSFVVSNTLYVGAAGAGTVTIGDAGHLRCDNLVLSNNTSSTLRFEVSTNGSVGQLVITNALTVAPGARLEVYVPDSMADLPTMTLTLATYATNVGSFADVDMIVSNYPLASVTQTTTNLQVLIKRRPRGTLMIAR